MSKTNIFIPYEMRGDVERIAQIVAPHLRDDRCSFYEGGLRRDGTGGCIDVRAADGRGLTIMWDWEESEADGLIRIYNVIERRNEMYDAPTFEKVREVINELLIRYEKESKGYTEGAIALDAVFDRLRGLIS